MNCKSMVLVALLLPAFCYSQTKEDRIKELEDRQWEKLLEIEKIEMKITNSYKFTEYIRDNSIEQMYYAVGRRERIKKLASKYSNPNNTLIEQNIPDENSSIAYRLYQTFRSKFAFNNSEQIERNFCDNIDPIVTHLYQALRGKCDFDYDLAQELFITRSDELNSDDFYTIDDFDTLKFIFLKMVTERARQDRLVTFYQKLLDELCAIGQELATLKRGGVTGGPAVP